MWHEEVKQKDAGYTVHAYVHRKSVHRIIHRNTHEGSVNRDVEEGCFMIKFSLKSRNKFVLTFD